MVQLVSDYSDFDSDSFFDRKQNFWREIRIVNSEKVPAVPRCVDIQLMTTENGSTVSRIVAIDFEY